MNLKYELYKLLFEISHRLPNWLFKFHKGTIYSTKTPKLIIRENHKFIIDQVQKCHIKELSDFSGFPADWINARLNAGDIGIFSREIESQKIKTNQWAHIGNAYIQQFNVKLNISENAAYFYWAYSVPEVRITGIFNTAFQKMIDLLHEKNVIEFYGIVEFWNKNAHRFHHRLKFTELASVLYLKILFLRITFHKDISSRKVSCNIYILKIKNIDII